MSIEIVKSVIKEFLAKDAHEVLAIKGSWGTGKTYTWNKILNISNEKSEVALGKYAYVSLFGINSLKELKIAIFEQTVSRELIGKRATIKTFKEQADALTGSFGRKSFLSILKGISVPYIKDLSHIFLSLSFLYVKDTIICFDDFERKGDNLLPKDILGLTSILKEFKNCKVVLIFNEESLDDITEGEYKKFREKVIDKELSFIPTPEECSSIVFHENTDITNKLKEYSNKLNITNIRILIKIKRSSLDVCQHLTSYEPELIQQVCHTITLLTWCYFSGENNVPKYDYVKSLSDTYMDMEDMIEPTEEEKGWSAILQNYGFNQFDEFDLVLANIVENGYVARQELKEKADKKNEEFIAHKKGNDFHDVWKRLYHGSFDDNEAELIKKLDEGLRSSIKYVYVNDLDGTVRLFRKLDKDDLANELIEFYIDKNRDKADIFNLSNYPFSGDIKDSTLIKRFNEVFLTLKTTKSFQDVISDLISKNGYSMEDKKILSETSPEEYYHFFKSISGESLHDYIKAVWQFGAHQSAEDIDKKIRSKVTEALKKIAAENRLNARRISRYGIYPTDNNA